jgi:toxin ParE1/3/4
MTQIKFTNAARQDLKSIFTYTVRTWGKRQAEQYSAQLKAHMLGISTSTAFSKPVQGSRNNLKQSAVGRHIVVFEQTDAQILIVRILHASMDIPRHVSGGH